MHHRYSILSYKYTVYFFIYFVHRQHQLAGVPVGQWSAAIFFLCVLTDSDSQHPTVAPGPFYLFRCCSSSQIKNFTAISSWPCTRTTRTLMESVSRNMHGHCSVSYVSLSAGFPLLHRPLLLPRWSQVYRQVRLWWLSTHVCARSTLSVCVRRACRWLKQWVYTAAVHVVACDHVIQGEVM